MMQGAPIRDLDQSEEARLADLRLGGYGRLPASGLVARPDWAGFAGSWDDLPIDDHMADGGRYRRRRYGAFTLVDGRLLRAPHQAHYQALSFNPLNGGVERWFAPMGDAVAGSAILAAIAVQARDLIAGCDGAPRDRWAVEIHQFRIMAGAGARGLPTPEGIHRDGRDWVSITLVARHNVVGGATLIEDADGRALDRFTLRRPGEALLLDDRRVWHGTTPILPVDQAEPAWRDALVMTFAAS